MYNIYEMHISSLTVAENYAKRSIILSVQVSLGSRKFQRYEEPQQMIEKDVSPITAWCRQMAIEIYRSVKPPYSIVLYRVLY